MSKRTTHKARIGSTFDAFLKDEGTYERTQAGAIKRVLAWQLDRLLDPGHNSITLETLTRAARAIGRQLKLELV